jgi:hypothetical protein
MYGNKYNKGLYGIKLLQPKPVQEMDAGNIAIGFSGAAPEGTQIKLGIYTSSAFGETSVISRVLSCLRRVLTAVKPAKPEPIIVIFFIF